MSIPYRRAAVPAGLAALAAITAIPAGAAVITVSGLNAHVAANTTYQLDISGPGSRDVGIYNSFRANSGFASVYSFGYFTPRPVAANTLIQTSSIDNLGDAKAYTLANVIDTTSASSRSDLAIGDNLYLPFAFTTASGNNFGWIDLSIHNPNPRDAAPIAAYIVTVNGYGYDNTGAAVLAGAPTSDNTSVPEPSSLLLLAAGFAGFSAMRRKSRAAAFTA